MTFDALAHFIAESESGLGGRATIEPGCIREILKTAYEASLRQDELRRISFRLIVVTPERFESAGGTDNGFLPYIFEEPRAYTPHELRKLAPAVGFSRAMIAVWPNEAGELKIRGIIYTGATWLRVVQGGRGAEVLIPDAFIVHVLAPGSMESRYGSLILSQLKHGQPAKSKLDVFESTWLPARFEGTRLELLERFENGNPEEVGKVDPLLFGRLTQQMIKRLIAAIQGNRHGGAVLIGPGETLSAAMQSGNLVLRQKFRRTSAVARHAELMLRAASQMTSLGSNLTSRKVGWLEYMQMSHSALDRLDEAVFDEAYFLGGIAGADGTVVLTDRFEVIGFGGEIFAHDVYIKSVFRSLDLEGTNCRQVSADSFGTRHRSAFRFVSKYPDCLAVVISQDGEVRFIVNKEGDIYLFEHEAALVVELVL